MGSEPTAGAADDEGGAVRALVAIAPRYYREAVALYVHRRRPSTEVLIVAPKLLDAQVERFEPHLVVYNEVTESVRVSTPSWAEILFKDGLDANVSGDELGIYRIEDIGMDDLLRVLDETAVLLRGE